MQQQEPNHETTKREFANNPKANWLKRFLRIPKLSEWIAIVFAVITALLGLVGHFAAQPDTQDLVMTLLVATALLGMLLVVFVQTELITVLIGKDDNHLIAESDLQHKLNDARARISQLEETESKTAKAFADAADRKAAYHLNVLSTLSAAYGEQEFEPDPNGTS